jgi:hypothetical protein
MTMVALRHDLGAKTVRPARLRLVPGGALPLVRRDTLPEHAEYRDTGCELAPSCLRCPMRYCKFDEPRANAATRDRDREIAALRRRHGAPIDMLAGTYGLTRRSIFRILSEQPR